MEIKNIFKKGNLFSLNSKLIFQKSCCRWYVSTLKKARDRLSVYKECVMIEFGDLNCCSYLSS